MTRLLLTIVATALLCTFSIALQSPAKTEPSARQGSNVDKLFANPFANAYVQKPPAASNLRNLRNLRMALEDPKGHTRMP
ncbi:MAG: hypothetical protein SGJ11_11520 [Phycisphaerae bacterium]|nr:hypothetical protein [Phycisphaerae bacterium]